MNTIIGKGLLAGLFLAAVAAHPGASLASTKGAKQGTKTESAANHQVTNEKQHTHHSEHKKTQEVGKYSAKPAHAKKDESPSASSVGESKRMNTSEKTKTEQH